MDVEPLEHRVVLAAGIEHDPASRTIAIVGSDGDDSAEIWRQGQKIIVSVKTATGDFIRRLNATAVSRVVFTGLDGNDTFTNRTAVASQADGGEGDDILIGGRGSDTFRGGEGEDTIHGKAGADTLDGGPGHDAAWGGTGNDLIVGNAGNDRLAGDSGADALWGHLGDDELLGGNGNDSLQAGAGNDRLDGELGRDELVGGDGLDMEVDVRDRFTDGDSDGDGFDDDLDAMDILYGAGSELNYAPDDTVASIITAVSGQVRSLLDVPAADAGLRVRVQRDQFGDLVTGVWSYLTPDMIQVWGRWAYPAADPSQLNAFVQYEYTGPFPGGVADYTDPANYGISEESRLHASFLNGPLTFVGWLPGEPAGFFYSAPDEEATGFRAPIEALTAALSSLPNLVVSELSFAGNFAQSPGLPGIQPVIDLVRTIDRVTRAARVRPA